MTSPPSAVNLTAISSSVIGDLLAENEQVVFIWRPLVCLDAFEIAHVTETLVFVEDADAAEEVAGRAGDVERDGHVVTLCH